VPEAVFQVVFGMPGRPSEIVPGLPRAVDDVLAIALAKRPDDRFATAAELAEALAAAVDGRLPSEMHSRAATLLAACPWGHRPGDESIAETKRSA
jgi:serine/threonine-protein kinase